MKKGQKVKNQEICEIYASIVGLHLERTEAELRRQEQVRRHEATIEATGAGTVEWEMTQDPPKFSRQCWALLGMTEEDKGLKTWLERVHPQDRPKVQHYLDEAGEKVNNTQELHFRVKHVDGQWRWIMSRSKLLKTEAGLPWRWVATLVDVTDLIQAQKQTILEKEFLSNVLEGTNAGTWEWDLERDQVYVNPRWREISGRSLVKPVSQEELFNSMEPGDALKARAQMKAVLDKREAYYAVEARFKSEEGRWVWILDHGRVIAWSEEGQPLRMFGTRMDITENKYLELARQDSEAQYKILIDNSFDIIYRLSEEGHFTYVSPAWSRLLSQSIEAVIGRSFRPYVHPEDLPAVEAFFEKIKITQQRQELEYYRLKHADGSWRWYFTNAIPIWDEQGLVVGFAGSARDVTTLKETQDALIMQKDELERFFSINLDLLCIVQTDGRFVRVNKAWETTLGYPLESLLNKNILELIHPDDLEPTKKALETLEHQEEVVNFVNRYRCQDGSYRQIEWRSRPYGTLVYAAARDITQRMNIEAQLHLEKEQFQTTLLSVADGVFSTDPNGRITLANQAACTMLGWEFSEIKGRSLDTVLRISDSKGFSLLNLADQVIEKGEVFEIKDSTLTTRSGKQKRIEGSVAPVKDRSGNITGTVVVFRDVTDRVHREKEVEFLSFNDALTGLYNRRYMEDALQRLDGARNLPLTILFADVNGLKLTNDAYGHRMGDKLLQVVAEILKKACRSDDILCRVGGDEFALLLPKTDYDQGMAVKRRILDIAETKTLEPLVISIGMGIATKRTPDQSLKEIQVQADQAMYQDKLKRGQLMRGETIERALKNICMLYTGEEDHILRVSRYCQEFAEGLNLGNKEIEEAKKAGLLHDIGKIALPPEMLNKKGALTQQQWREVRRHPLTGYHILKGVDRYASLAEAVLYHHEHYDGAGYPRGLKGKKIPLLARMIAIADSYEAMTGERNYKKKMTQGEAVEELRRCSGSQFDPELAKVFLEKVIKIQE